MLFVPSKTHFKSHSIYNQDLKFRYSYVFRLQAYSPTTYSQPYHSKNTSEKFPAIKIKRTERVGPNLAKIPSKLNFRPKWKVKIVYNTITDYIKPHQNKQPCNRRNITATSYHRKFMRKIYEIHLAQFHNIYQQISVNNMGWKRFPKYRISKYSSRSGWNCSFYFFRLPSSDKITKTPSRTSRGGLK